MAKPKQKVIKPEPKPEPTPVKPTKGESKIDFDKRSINLILKSGKVKGKQEAIDEANTLWEDKKRVKEIITDELAELIPESSHQQIADLAHYGKEKEKPYVKAWVEYCTLGGEKPKSENFGLGLAATRVIREQLSILGVREN